MAKKAATPATVTLKHLAAAIAEDQELSKKQAESILSDVVTMITKHLKKGERIRFVALFHAYRHRTFPALCRDRHPVGCGLADLPFHREAKGSGPPARLRIAGDGAARRP